MTAPKVTVLMSVLNGEDYLREAIDSVLAQTFMDFEFLIIDNASTDMTPRIIASYSDSRIRVLRNDNVLTLTQSLNKGMRAARGDLIARLDADDLAMPERLEKQVRFLDAHPDVFLVACAWTDFDENTPSPGVAAPVPPPDHESLLSALARDNVLAHSTLCFRREAVLTLGGYPEEFEYAMEYALYFRLAARHRLAALPDALVALRNHGGQITRSPAWHVKRLRENLRVAEIAADSAAMNPLDRRQARDHCIRLATRLGLIHFQSFRIFAAISWTLRAMAMAPGAFIRLTLCAVMSRARSRSAGPHHA